jgi:serine/threonine protein phosphatase PrpC
VGDSDAVVCGFAAGAKARVVSRRHRPDADGERKRCVAAGAAVADGYVMDDARLPRKMIAVTRALGDRDVRALGVVSTAEVVRVDVEVPGFVILATDGLWDAHGGSVGPQRAADLVRRYGVREGCEALMEAACGVDERFPSDDCSIVVIGFGVGLGRGDVELGVGERLGGDELAERDEEDDDEEQPGAEGELTRTGDE